jgi:tetratricopeptide (TPR) repeat protein
MTGFLSGLSANTFCPVEFFDDFHIDKNIKLSESGKKISESLADYAVACIDIRKNKKCTDFAENKLLESVRKYPSSSKPLNLLVACWKKNARQENILKYLKPLAEKHRNALALNLIVGDYLVSKGNLKDALKLLHDTYKNSDFSAEDTEYLAKLGELTAKISDIYLKLNLTDEGEEFWDDVQYHKNLLDLLIVRIAAVDFFAQYADKGPDGFFAGWAKRRYRRKLDSHLKAFEKLWEKSDMVNALILRPVLKVCLRYKLTDLGEKLLLTSLLHAPYNSSAFVLLAKYYFDTGQFAFSELAWKQIINSDNYTQAPLIWRYMTGNNEGDFYFQLGNAAFYAEDYEEAIRSFNWYILLHPDSAVRARFKVAFSYMFLQDWKHAAGIFKKISNIPQGAYYAALCHAKLNDYDKALDYIVKAEQEALRLKNKEFLDKQFYMQFADIAEKAGKTEKAEIILINLFNQYRNDPAVSNFLAYLWAENNLNLKKALLLAKRSVKAEPENSAYLDTLAWVYFKMKKFKKAKAEIIKALKCAEYNIPDAVILDHAGDIFAALNINDKALEYWKKALTVYSEELDQGKVKDKIDNITNSAFRQL